MSRDLRLTHEHVLRFAAASGDRNPLHVDDTFARATPFGRPIAHGALVAIAALGAVEQDELLEAQSIQLQFKHPVFPGAAYTVVASPAGPAKLRLQVLGAGKVVTTLTVTGGANGDAAPLGRPAVERDPATVPSGPRRHSIEALATDGFEFGQSYACDLHRLAELATDLGAPRVPRALLSWLAAASYTIGMIVPGRDAVFTGGRIVRLPGRGAGHISGAVTTADDRTGFVTVDCEATLVDASASLALTAFLRPPVPPPTRDAVAEYLPPSEALAGRNVLVVGASRGLGAALAGALATQGATVWAGFAESRDHVTALSDEFGADRLKPLQLDARDAEQVQRALSAVTAPLDGLVLAAAPPLYEAALVPEAVADAVEFVRESVALVLAPLAAAGPMLSADSFVVVLSSPVVEEPPEQWPHYVIAKAAVESAAAYCRRHLPARVVVVRPPKSWTDSTNTPLGRIGAERKEQVAAAIVRRLTSNGGHAVLSPDDLRGPPVAET